ncbi:MAG: hypothetical protein EOO54_06010 [Haliea sp.]|nr:MAG: hypothetical protein EOO54_06010 [Haliea sp.]
MDSKVVTREIKRLVWPLLKKSGFDTFTSRVAWRHTADQIDVLAFESFNAYNADIMEVTTFSFAVRLGTFPLYIPPQWPPKVKNGVQLPHEAACPFRRSLQTTLQFPLSDKSIWSVDRDGRNLSWCMQDVLKQIPDALGWYSRLAQREYVLDVLQDEHERNSGAWGFGNNPSPIRAYLTGYAALAVGNRALAETKLQEAVDSKCFTQLFSSVPGAISRAV